MESTTSAVPCLGAGNFVVMDNGTRFYLHVIGISAMSQPNKLELAEINTATIQ